MEASRCDAIVDSRHFDQRSTSLKTSANRRIIAVLVLFFLCVAPLIARQLEKSPGAPKEKPQAARQKEQDGASREGPSREGSFPDGSSRDNSGSAREDKISPEEQAVLDHISADSMRGHLSF